MSRSRIPKFLSISRTRISPVVWWLVLILSWGAGAATALILDSGDGLGNTQPPEDDPGWNHIGHHLGGPSVVYLGNGWVLTAQHAGASIVLFQGERFNPVPGSIVQLESRFVPKKKPSGEGEFEGGGESEFRKSDLLLFRIDGDPGLPLLALAESTPKIGEDALLIAAGSSRGRRLTVDTPESGLRDGFEWQTDRTTRWGTNIVHKSPTWIDHLETSTRAFPLIFDRLESRNSTPHEAGAARGDSGGALFTRANPVAPENGWVLSGILFSVSGKKGQPKDTTFYGDATWVADLSHYREQIRKLVWPDCRDLNPRLGRAPECPAAAPPVSPVKSGMLFPAAAIGLLLALLGWWRWSRRRVSPGPGV